MPCTATTAAAANRPRARVGEFFTLVQDDCYRFREKFEAHVDMEYNADGDERYDFSYDGPSGKTFRITVREWGNLDADEANDISQTKSHMVTLQIGDQTAQDLMRISSEDLKHLKRVWKALVRQWTATR